MMGHENYVGKRETIKIIEVLGARRAKKQY